MDFSGLANNLSGQISRQLAEQLLSNPILRDAAVKSAQEEDDTSTSTTTEEAPDSGLDNLLNQLSAALTRAAEQPADAPTTTSQTDDAAPAPDQSSLLDNEVVQQLLAQLDLQTALSLKVLLGGLGSEAAETVSNFVSQLPASTIDKVACCLEELDPDDITKAVDLFKLMFQTNNDEVFHQRDNADVYYNAVNIEELTPADLDEFLRTSYQVMRAGGDMGAFMDASAEVLQKGDYDDFRRFLEVADMVMYKGESLAQYFQYSNSVLAANPKSYEGNIFEAYVVMAHGGTLQDYIDIAENLGTTTEEGSNNLVNLNTVITDFRKQGGYTPMLINEMVAEAKSGGSVEQFIQDYLDARGFQAAGPDYSKFDVIGRVDGEVMEITEGDNAALFAQAISSRDGLLPESVLYWSSKETGGLINGTSYLDLSQLQAGTYHIAVKIGGYAGGTDTAIKTVVVKDADGNVPEVAGGVIPGGTLGNVDPGGVRVGGGDRGHGNDADGVDEQNPAGGGIDPTHTNGTTDDDGDVPGAASGTDSVGGAQATQSSDEVDVVLPPLTKEEAAEVTEEALGLAQANAQLEAIRNLLNERYYRSLDAQVEFNQDYTRQLQEYMADRVDTTDNQLETLLGQIIGELTGTDPVQQAKDAAAGYYNPYSVYRNPYA